MTIAVPAEGDPMKKAIQAMKESCHESFQACDGLSSSLNSIKPLVGKPNRKSNSAGLKTIGTTLLLIPSPEPFTDVLGLALIGAGVAAERRQPPLTITELCEESRSIFKGLNSSKPLGRGLLF